MSAGEAARAGPGGAARAIPGFERVCEGAIAPRELRAVRLADGTPLCVGNADGRLFAVRDECPHSAFPLSQGQLLGGTRLECGWHGATFDCGTGAVLGGPAEDPLVLLEVRAEGGAIWVRAPGAGT